MITIKLEPLAHEVITELSALIEANHRDAAAHQKLGPDWWTLVKMPLKLWVMRDDGAPVGYCAHWVQPHLFFSGEMQATAMAIYVLDASRGHVAQFLRYVEQGLLEYGVKTINYSVPHLSRAGAFFEAIGYNCTELIMTKRVQAETI
jgi:hypothetical protein